MQCPNCSSETHKLTISNFGTSCPDCKPNSKKDLPWIKILIGNKHYPKMSLVMRNNIVTRKIAKDGFTYPDPKWRDSTERRMK